MVTHPNARIATHADAPVALDTVWGWLAEVPDPEVPAVNVVDLGIVRDVVWTDVGGAHKLEVTITPTYTGCPATAVIGRDIVRALHEHGVPGVRIRTQLDPSWTTDWLTDTARGKLRAYGVAPPVGNAAQAAVPIGNAAQPQRVVACPRCASSDTSCLSEFGSTPCKALYRCNACREPFDHFKCH